MKSVRSKKRWPPPSAGQVVMGICAGCGRTLPLLTGRCHPCRHPVDRRQLIRAGVPCGSADALARLVRNYIKRGKNGIEIEEFLALVHPKLMENISVTNAGALRLTSRKYKWIRRGGWEKIA